jgi:tRNA-Thr(GGU) m(6)t(6)A37 methyltransferase TsaA
VASLVSYAPIGIIHTPFSDRLSAPRQAAASRSAEGSIELYPGRDFEHALEDLVGWERLWVIFCFHMNPAGVWRPKVLPPRSAGKRRGVFATRSPHRPNPIGLSAVRLMAVQGRVLHVRDVDMIDGSPVLDLKPYVPYADAFPSSRTGWLAPLAPVTPVAMRGEPGYPPAQPVTMGAAVDPEPGFCVAWTTLAEGQAAWLLREHGVDLRERVDRVLELGPQPHPYRRIKAEGDAFRLALKEWRVRFRVEGRAVTVDEIRTGYRPSQLAAPASPELAVHRAFAERFPSGA